MARHLVWADYREAFVDRCGGPAVHGAPALLELLRSLMSAGFSSVSLAGCLLEDAIAAEEVASRSYLHPNGFEKIVLLAPGPELPSLRLHIWPASGDSRREEQMHNHRWPFASRVEHGALRFVTYEPDPAGEQYTHVAATSPASADESYRHDIVGDARLRMTFDGVLAAGTEYCLPQTTPHRVVAASGLCSTLMLQGPAARVASEVFLRASDSDANTIEVRPTTRELLQATLEDYCAKIAAA